MRKTWKKKPIECRKILRYLCRCVRSAINSFESKSKVTRSWIKSHIVFGIIIYLQFNKSSQRRDPKKNEKNCVPSISDAAPYLYIGASIYILYPTLRRVFYTRRHIWVMFFFPYLYNKPFEGWKSIFFRQQRHISKRIFTR